MAIGSGEGTSVVEALADVELSEIAQLAGEALLVALSQHVDRARTTSESCIGVLRERGFDGDDVLSEQLEIAIGRREGSDLRSVPIDLEELSWVLEGEGEGRVDLATGEVFPMSVLDDDEEWEEDFDNDTGRWLYVYGDDSSEGYRDMEDFIATVEDEGLADRLSIAISGKGAFRRFKDVISRSLEEETRWYVFSEERQRGRARSWLRSEGILALPKPHRAKG